MPSFPGTLRPWLPRPGQRHPHSDRSERRPSLVRGDCGKRLTPCEGQKIDDTHVTGATTNGCLDIAPGHEQVQPCGWMRNDRGVSSSSASPSIPTKALPDLERTSNSVVVNSNAWSLFPPRPARARVTTCAACAPVAALTAEQLPDGPSRVVGVARHPENAAVTYGLFDTMMRNDPSTSFPSGVVNCRSKGLLCPTQEFRQQDLRGLGLCLPIPLLLHDHRIDPERDVVDEEPIVDGCIVNVALYGVSKRHSTLARGVIAIESKVQGEVVAGSRRNTDEGDPTFHSDRSNECAASRPLLPCPGSRLPDRLHRGRVARDQGRARGAPYRSRGKTPVRSGRNFSTFPPPDQGLQRSTGWAGREHLTYPSIGGSRGGRFRWLAARAARTATARRPNVTARRNNLRSVSPSCT